MESQFLQVGLALVQEHQLRRDLHFAGFVLHLLDGNRLVHLNREVPEREFVVRRADRKHRFFPGLELNAGDGGVVPLDARNRVHVFVGRLRAQHAQVPNSEFALVVPGSEQELSLGVPRDHVDVAVVGGPADLRALLSSPQVPQLDGLVATAGGKHVVLGGRPLHVFNRPLVSLQTYLRFLHEAAAGFVSCLVQPKLRVTGS